MKKWVREKLAIIDDLYPAERINTSKKRWQAHFSGDGGLDRIPFVYSPATIDYYVGSQDSEQRLLAFLDEFIIRGVMNDDFIPSFFPGCRQSTIPSMFGAKELIHGDDYIAEQLFENIEDIAGMPYPSITQGGIANAWLEMQSYFVNETDGKIPVHVTDMQGPADVCGQIFGYDNFFMSSYTNPELFHRLMENVTDAFIMLWKKQQDLLGDLFIGTHLFGWDWVPKNYGASLSADSLVMISPEYYDEFYKPYFTRIGETFRGLSIHSCGDFSNVIKNICRTPSLKAVNAGEMSIPEMLDAGMDSKFVMTAKSELTDVPLIAKLAHEKNLKLGLSIAIWPCDDLSAMDSSEWGKLKKTEKNIIELMSF